MKAPQVPTPSTLTITLRCELTNIAGNLVQRADAKELLYRTISGLRIDIGCDTRKRPSAAFTIAKKLHLGSLVEDLTLSGKPLLSEMIIPPEDALAISTTLDVIRPMKAFLTMTARSAAMFDLLRCDRLQWLRIDVQESDYLFSPPWRAMTSWISLIARAHALQELEITCRWIREDVEGLAAYLSNEQDANLDLRRLSIKWSSTITRYCRIDGPVEIGFQAVLVNRLEQVCSNRGIALSTEGPEELFF